MGDPQTLEDFITSKFTALALDVPADDVEYMARLVEEEELPEEDKKEGVRGMVEMHLPEDQPPSLSTGLDTAIEEVIERWKQIEEEKRVEPERAEEEGSGSEDDSDGDENDPTSRQSKRTALLSSLTPEELALAQKRALLAQYGYVDDPSAGDDGDNGDPAAAVRGSTLRQREEEKIKEERRRMIDEAIRMEGRRRKKSKRSKEEVNLMAPNLNKDKVQAKQQFAREAARQESAVRRDRDKAALDKQRADQAKAKADKQKKAQKQERRA